MSFDCSDSDIDSDLDDLSRRPTSEADRAKQHARQLQLWSDEARRRRSPAPAPGLSPRRRPSSASLHDVIPSSLGPPAVPAPPKLAPTELRRLSADRQQSNLSERARLPNSRRVSRSHSAKNLRIRITPSSSSKSLLSDIESELGNSASASAPQSPRVGPLMDMRPAINEKPALRPSLGENDKRPHGINDKGIMSKPAQAMEHNEPAALTLTPIPNPDHNKANKNDTGKSTTDSARPNLSRRMSFHVRGRRLPSWRKLWRR